MDFAGRVAVITGAGGGLGRSHAVLLASRGAKVVVNDLGVDRHGEAGTAKMADAVVAEIVDAGGEAVANHDGVHTWEGGEAIIRAARDAFGRVDIVVNNAGILRDVSFKNLTADQLDTVLKVHLYGAFHVTKAAWPYLRDNSYGRVINTTSGSGLYGNFGQSNYAAAKMGVVGLTRALAQEGASYNITCNAIAPIAASRLTEDVLTPQLLERLDPAFISPLVAHLAWEGCTETGRIYYAGGGYYARVAVVEGTGHVFDHVPQVEELAEHWSQIASIQGAREYANLGESTFGVAQALRIDSTPGATSSRRGAGEGHI
ncbi:MAG: SDR family oxidoreductase [Actinomycetota bacterium]|nr:SDR family oxidoreductase [Actinomycetota bacterium]